MPDPNAAAAAAAAAQQPTSLMREKDLVPSLNIPEKLFESESENSDSEAVSRSSYPFQRSSRIVYIVKSVH